MPPLRPRVQRKNPVEAAGDRGAVQPTTAAAVPPAVQPPIGRAPAVQPPLSRPAPATTPPGAPPPIAPESRPQGQRRRSNGDACFRLPDGSTFHACYDATEARWHGELCVPRLEPMHLALSSVHNVLKGLGQRWWNEFGSKAADATQGADKAAEGGAA
jgi:hypothetical protein